MTDYPVETAAQLACPHDEEPLCLCVNCGACLAPPLTTAQLHELIALEIDDLLWALSDEGPRVRDHLEEYARQLRNCADDESCVLTKRIAKLNGRRA